MTDGRRLKFTKALDPRRESLWRTAVYGLAVLASATSTANAQTPAATPHPGATAKAGASALPPGLDPIDGPGAYRSTYRPAASGDIAIVNATILTAAGPRIDKGVVLISGNRVTAVGADLAVPAGYRRIDAQGKWVTPGIIDGHSHMGAVNIPSGSLEDGLNEMSDPNTAQIMIEHALWPQNPDLWHARAAGVTTLNILPGSANLFGGRAVIVKNVPAVTIQAMKFPDQPMGVKMACGENPTRVYGPKGRAPVTRAGDAAVTRAAFISAADYARRWKEYRDKVGRGEKGDPPKRDLQLDTISGILDGSVRVHMHCYRADDMANMMDMAGEFGFKVAAFHHATEAFKILPLLIDRGVCIFTWGGPDWGGFKAEAYDHTALEVGMAERAGACVAVTSDSEFYDQRLILEAGRSMTTANRYGLGITPAEAIKWVTLNPARGLGIADRTGSLEPGKMADVVVWSGNPFSVYSRPEQVLVDGVEVYRADDPRYVRGSDYELYQAGQRNESDGGDRP
jgi:imidazolonepropionase-like amidohydrolase